MQRFFNFTSVALAHVGTGPARIVRISHQQLQYLNDDGAALVIDLEMCARTYRTLQNAGLFPPGDDTDWAKLAAADPSFSTREVRFGCVGLRGAIDEPPWFQFLDQRRTQFEFPDYDAIQSDLLRPLGAAGWQTWDAS